MWLLLWGSGCADSGEKPDSNPGSTNTRPTSAPPPVFVLAGGGTEGDDGDRDAWSARLYPALWENGDINDDGAVQVVVLSTAEESDWLPQYLVWLGADVATNLRVATREAAEDASTLDPLRTADALFIKGGDQGEYYDLFNETQLDRWVLELVAAGGGVGGTSAGAMSLGGWALAGGMDLVTADVLADAHTPYLDDDSDGGSGLHDDFFGLIPGVLVDTHFTQRARLGRLAGALARIHDDDGDDVLGVGLEEQTGVVVRTVDGRRQAEVLGVGAVSWLWSGGDAPTRVPGAPLGWTGLRLDRITEGWTFDLESREASPPADAVMAVLEDAPPPEGAEWYVDGDYPAHEERFAWVTERDPLPYGLHPGADTPTLAGGVGVVDAFDSDRRAAAEEALFRALYDLPGSTGYLVPWGGGVNRVAPDRLELIDNPEVDDPPEATILIESRGMTYKTLSPVPSLADPGDGGLQAAGMAGLKVHILYTPLTGLGWDPVAAAPDPE